MAMGSKMGEGVCSSRIDAKPGGRLEWEEIVSGDKTDLVWIENDAVDSVDSVVVGSGGGALVGSDGGVLVGGGSGVLVGPALLR